MRKLTLNIVLVLVVLCSATVLHAQTQRNSRSTQADPFGQHWGFGLKASTNGVGFEIIKGLGEKVNLRIGSSTLTIPYETIYTVQGFDLLASANLGFGGINGFIDLHATPWLHLTAGAVKNNMYHTVRITSAEALPLGTVEVPIEEVGFVLAELTPQNEFSPYVGLGFGTVMPRKSNFSFNFEIGGIYHGEPQLALSGEGIIGPIASEENREIIMAALAPYKWYPLVTLQFTFRLQ